MFRDFAIVSTAFGADLREIKKVGVIGVLSLVMGLVISWVAGVIVAYAFGYRDTISIITIAAGVYLRCWSCNRCCSRCFL